MTAPRSDRSQATVSPVRLSVDCMGGDHGPSITLPACQAFLRKHPDAELVLVGLPDVLAAAKGWERVTLVNASEVVTMDDPVEVALRKKKDSSMRVAINQVKATAEQPAFAHACVSAGNTGALMAVEHLLQFAVMGSVLVSVLKGVEEPTVGLLNIGEEVIKGSEVIKKTGELLRAADSRGLINFYGNVEGNDIFKGTSDLVVCDGFVGNVALKTAEGLATKNGLTTVVTTVLLCWACEVWFSKATAQRMPSLLSKP